MAKIKKIQRPPKADVGTAEFSSSSRPETTGMI